MAYRSDYYHKVLAPRFKIIFKHELSNSLKNLNKTKSDIYFIQKNNSFKWASFLKILTQLETIHINHE